MKEDIKKRFRIPLTILFMLIQFFIVSILLLLFVFYVSLLLDKYGLSPLILIIFSFLILLGSMGFGLWIHNYKFVGKLLKIKEKKRHKNLSKKGC